MRKFFKAIGFVVIGLIIFGIAGALGSEETVTVPTTDQPAKEEVKKVPKKELITKENFDTITVGDIMSGEGGMTVDQVVAVFGEPDSKTESESPDMNGGTYKMEMYSWSTLSMKGVSVTFVNGLVSNKLWME